MFSTATMRLVGLLVIVGVVAGCGGEEAPPAGTEADARRAELTMQDARALWNERERLQDEERSVFADAHRGDTENEAALGEWNAATQSIYDAGVAIVEMEGAIERGEQDAARDAQHAALAQLQATRRHLDLAREALEQE